MVKKIIHLSDIHFGEKTFSKDLIYKVLSQLRKEKPDLIIVSGDITQNGYKYEYEMMKKFIERLIYIAKTFVVPGNHDARNVGLIHFEKLIGPRKFVHLDNDHKVVIIGLDSSEPDINDGQIGFDQLMWLNEELSKVSNEYCKMVVFHHHLLPIPNTGRERNILLDSGDLIQILLDDEVDIVLNGHKHVPNVWMLEKMIVINAGTATTLKLRGETLPSYNELLIYDDKIIVNLIHTENNEKIKVAEYFIKQEESEFLISKSKKYNVNHHIH